AEDGIRDRNVTGVQTCALPICAPFAMTVLAYDPYLTADEAMARGAEKVELDELLERSDFVHLNCPLTPETEGLMGRDQFARMKKIGRASCRERVEVWGVRGICQ